MKLKLVIPATLAIVFAACATVKVSTDYDRSKDFTAVKTYAMHSNMENAVQGQTANQLNRDRIVAAIKQQLNAKGYTESATPDFTVNVNVIIKDMASITANTTFDDGAYFYGGAYRPYGYWGVGGLGTATTSFDVDKYQNGSLIIDMVDAKTNRLFWEGIGEADIDGAVSNPDKKINAAVADILKTYPKAGHAIGK